jgi:hypothetical protein
MCGCVDVWMCVCVRELWVGAQSVIVAVLGMCGCVCVCACTCACMRKCV